MTDSWVINASPVILYSRVNHLGIIEQVAPAVAIPDVVVEEIRRGMGKDDKAQQAAKWAQTYVIPAIETVDTIVQWDIGAGESQVISHCMKSEKWAVLDDRMARRCAIAQDVPVIGSIGIALRAQRLGLIISARQLVYKLKSAGMYADDDLLERCLAAVGEGNNKNVQ